MSRETLRRRALSRSLSKPGQAVERAGGRRTVPDGVDDQLCNGRFRPLRWGNGPETLGSTLTDPNLIEIPYGDDSAISLDASGLNIAGVMTPVDAAGAPSVETTLRAAIGKPIGSPTLDRLGEPGDQYLIVADDMTRETPVAAMIGIVAERLSAAGVSDCQIQVLIATGTHRPMTDAEIRERFGDELTSRFQIHNHDYQTSTLTDLGLTGNGTPISVNQRVLDADVVIGMSSIVPHHIPGYSGGSKIIQPRRLRRADNRVHAHVQRGLGHPDTRRGRESRPPRDGGSSRSRRSHHDTQHDSQTPAARWWTRSSATRKRRFAPAPRHPDGSTAWARPPTLTS